jgi:hypothetical protein
MRALRPPGKRRPSASFAVAAAALFVALGGPAEAQRLLSGSDIRKGTVTSKQIKDRSLDAKDLSAKARRALTATPAGSVADSSLTAADLGANAVGAEQLGDNAAGQAEIRNNGVGASEVADDSIDGGEIIDGGLRARDIARFSGTLEARFGSIAAAVCVPALVTGTAADAADTDISNDLVVASAPAGWPNQLSYHVKAAASPDTDKFWLVACNRTSAAVDPPDVIFRYVVIGS